jgi:type I restriction enzyme, S subunit
MSKVFSTVPLGEVLALKNRPEIVEPDRIYRILGAHWYAEGLYIKEIKLGSEIQADKVYRIEQGDFVYNRLFAWKGSFAVATADDDDCYVSNEFPSFIINHDKINPQYLQRYFCRATAWNEALGLSSGGTPTSRNRLKEDKLLSMRIPLPPLEEQQRIVTRIEELAAKIEEAQELRREVAEEVQSLFTSAMNSVWDNPEGWNNKPLRDLVTIVSGLVDPKEEPYASLPHINGEAMEAGTGRLLSYRVAKDDQLTSGKFHFSAGSILYSKIRPYLKKAVQVPLEGICSADVYAFEHIEHILEPRFFMYSLIAPPFTRYANDLSGRTRMPKLNQNQLLSFHMSYPNIMEQRHIVAYLDNLQSKVSTLKRQQAETSKELGTLLPSILDKAFKGEL